MREREWEDERDVKMEENGEKIVRGKEKSVRSSVENFLGEHHKVLLNR